MGKAREFVENNLATLHALARDEGHAGLRQFALTVGNLDNPTGFLAFKRALKDQGIDYEALRSAPGASRYLTVSALRKRGWTDHLVTRFLGPPDQTQPNPAYASAAPMRLYALFRITAAESLPQFEAALAAAQRRRRGSQKALATKRQRLHEQIAQMTVRVTLLSPEKLLKQAIRNYNDYREGDLARCDYTPAGLCSDPTFLERIQVNFIRHCLTRYDSALEALAGKVGVHDGIAAIRVKVYQAIGETYPQFKAECARQLAYRAAEFDA